MAPFSNIMFQFAAFAVLLFQADAAVVTATPIARVVNLLGKLEAQIEKEGKKEAAEYDKFACYCKDHADKTLYAIETSKEKIAVLKAAIEKLDAEITELGEDIVALSKTIGEKKEAIQTAVDKRKEENDAYIKDAEEIADAIGAIEGAIKELKGSKEDMKKAKLNLLQERLLEVLSSSSSPLSETRLRAVEALAQAPPSTAKNHAYEYRSNDIIGTLQNLLKEFKEQKKDVNVAEKDKLFAFEEKKQALENEKAFAEKDKGEKEKLEQDKTKEREDKQGDKDAETEAKEADDAYLAELTSDCESKAEQWDQRSKVRSDELTAISQALEKLKGGVSANYGSNALSAGASFLQLNHGRGSAAAVVARVAALVSGEAKRIQSSRLTGLALKLSMGGHFDSVVNLIKDLIQKLKDEASAAADSKTACDENMAKAVGKRDDNKLEMEDQGATIAMKKAEKVKLSGEVNKLNGEISELKKALLEATELRSNEKADNEQVLVDSKAGKEAVDDAIKVLQDFYSENALLQESGPAENRHGESIGGAPKLSYDGDYKGKQEASKGVIGILEVIQSDFQRTIDNTESEEGEAVTDFTAFEKKTNSDVDDKDKLITEKEGKITAATDAITDAKDDLMTAESLMNSAVEELEKVTAMCMTGEGTFAERKKQREEEIEALEGAAKILKDWKE